MDRTDYSVLLRERSTQYNQYESCQSEKLPRATETERIWECVLVSLFLDAFFLKTVQGMYIILVSLWQSSDWYVLTPH